MCSRGRDCGEGKRVSGRSGGCGEARVGKALPRKRVIVLQSEQDKLIRKTAVQDIHHFINSLSPTTTTTTTTEEEKV